MTVSRIATTNAPAAVGPYSQGVSTGQEAGSLVFVSGQVPLDPATGALVEGDIQAQAEQVLKNVGAILAEAGLGYDDVVKTTVLLADIADFAAVNEVYARYFTGETLPARAAFGVAALPLGAGVEIEAIAARPGAGPIESCPRSHADTRETGAGLTGANQSRPRRTGRCPARHGASDPATGSTRSLGSFPVPLPRGVPLSGTPRVALPMVGGVPAGEG